MIGHTCYESVSWLELMASSAYNLEIRIEERSLWKARTVVKENVKMSKYQYIKIANNSSIKWGSWTCVVTYWFEKIMDVSTFVLYFQFEIFCRSWFKFLIGNFIVVLIRNFLPDWEPEILKQLGPHRYFSGNWWNWWENKSALGIKYLHRRNFFNWVKFAKKTKSQPYTS